MLICSYPERQSPLLSLITFLKERFAAGTSRFALSINSIVLPAESTAR